MNSRRISVIALSNKDYVSFTEKLQEAVSWLEVAAAEGSELVVLPEKLNGYRGDGAGNDRALLFNELVLDDWQTSCEPLILAAQRLNLWITIPVVHHSNGKFWNSFFLVNPEGESVWRYDKVMPTPEELDKGITPGQVSTYDWRGIRLGGAICFDTCFPEGMERRADEGVQLFLIPSLWPGGSQLNHLCKLKSTRVALAYPAWSRMIDIDGKEIAEGGYRSETLRFGFGTPVFTATLNFDRVALFGNHNQEQMVTLLRKYGSRVRVTFDQGNCLWFLESCDPDLDEKDLMAEFGLVSASDYFRYCEDGVTRYAL